MKGLKLWRPSNPYVIAVMQSGRHIRARVFDRWSQATLFSVGTTDKEVEEKLLEVRKERGMKKELLPKYRTNVESMTIVGTLAAEKLKKNGVMEIEMAHLQKGESLCTKLLRTLNSKGIVTKKMLRDPAQPKYRKISSFFTEELAKTHHKPKTSKVVSPPTDQEQEIAG